MPATLEQILKPRPPVVPMGDCVGCGEETPITDAFSIRGRCPKCRAKARAS